VSDDDEPTLRDVLAAVEQLGDAMTARLDAHDENDATQFGSLSWKVLAAVLIAVGAAAVQFVAVIR
jgi:hypothetical protein